VELVLQILIQAHRQLTPVAVVVVAKLVAAA
jgi:hypothetical protein